MFLAEIATAQTWQPAPQQWYPSARNSSAIAFDCTRGRALAFGGYQGTATPLGDTWEYVGGMWIPTNPTMQPPARWGHGMAFDRRRNAIVMFGGYDGTGMRNDVWDWNGYTWNLRLIGTAPPPRAYMSMAYDAARGVVVVFGGNGGGSTVHGDTWELDGNVWIQRSPTSAPSARFNGACVWDEVRRETVVFGGNSGGSVLGDTWTWNGSAWTLRATSGPSARHAMAMAFDGNCGRAVLHGGSDAAFTTDYGDAWSWDGTQWSQLTGPQPSARHAAMMVHEAQRGQFVLWGGSDPSGFLSDTWELGPTCSRTMSTVVSPVVGQTAQFRYDYPPQPSGLLFCWTLFSPRHPGASQLLFGMPSIGLYRVDLTSLLLQPATLLDASGSLVTPVAIPPNPAFIGLQFDVQSVDLDLYTMTLRWAENDVEATIAAAVPPPTFTATPTSGGAPLAVQFTDSTPYATSWQWDFQNDGVIDSTLQNPSFTYTANGNYSVRLVASGPAGTNWVTHTGLITVGTYPAIAASPSVGAVPLTVQFLGSATFPVTSWSWDFQDDGIVDSTQQNPAFVYTANGNYSVRLTVTTPVPPFTRSVVRQAVSIGFTGYDPIQNLVAIAPGTFSMGSPVTPLNTAPHYNQAVAQPVHSVTISRPFWIGRHEVTQAQFQAVMGSNPSLHQGAAYPNAAQQPVERVTWNAAVTYCAALTAQERAAGRVPGDYVYRLPTEAEWEYCCRAGTTTEFHVGGSLACWQAHFWGYFPLTLCGTVAPSVVGSHAPNAWGLFNVHGNVSEWCQDSWDSIASYPSGAVTDPYVAIGTHRLQRGGSFASYNFNCRSAYRAGYDPTAANSFSGFRVVLAPPLDAEGPNPGLNMVQIAPGNLQMGSPVTPLSASPYYNQAYAQPVHIVTISRPFWIGSREVTQAEYEAVMGSNPSQFQGASYPDSPQRPVEQVSWNDAMAYCAALTVIEQAAGRVPAGHVYRLPTEAEWEYCCRAGTTTEFHYGPTLVCGQSNFILSYHPAVAFCSPSSGVQTTAVSSYLPNAWSLYDMHGNVAEWCLDCWDGITANYPASAVTDPYVTNGPGRILRGGRFGSMSYHCRSAFRAQAAPTSVNNGIGFRIVCAPPVP